MTSFVRAWWYVRENSSPAEYVRMLDVVMRRMPDLYMCEAFQYAALNAHR